jgi:outer membrane protein assembly factor BamA
MHLKSVKLTYYLAFYLVFILASCKHPRFARMRPFKAFRAVRFVPEGQALVKKNKIEIKGDKLSTDEVTAIIRQQPNHKTVGLKLGLYAYNCYDSLVVAQKREWENNQLRRKNKRKTARQKEVNERRVSRARRRNKEYYTEKTLQLKDTVNPKRSFSEWMKYKAGEPPVIFDTTLYLKTIEQLHIFLNKKGYYFGNVSAKTEHFKRRKMIATYYIETGAPYIIDSVKLVSDNPVVVQAYNKFVKKQGYQPLIGEHFDADMLDAYRSRVAKFMRDEALYGFSPSHITYKAYTNKEAMTVKLDIRFSDRTIKLGGDIDGVLTVPHQETYVRDVYFHLIDTTYSDNFRHTVESMELPLMENHFLRTIDTIHYNEIYYSRRDKLKRNLPPDSVVLNPVREAWIYYNGVPAIKPNILELQNYLEHNNPYKEYYLERSYTRMLQLDVFQTIKPDIIEIPGTNKIDVHYYLVPSDKQGFNFEPRFTNSNGFLGVGATVNYYNKNLFRGSQKLTISLSGGFESQPPVFDETLDGQAIKKAGRSFNTLEFGPSFKLDLPGLFPFSVTTLSKRQRPRTIISTAYNYQKRLDFQRSVFQLNYLYKFYSGKTQIFQIGLPFASVIKFVSIDKSPAFEAKLNLNNDVFLQNAYSDQFIWQDLKLTFEYNNKNKDNRKTKASVLFNSSFDPAGYFVGLFTKYQDTNNLGQKQIFGVAYSQFTRLDNTVIVGYPLDKKKSLNFRFSAGGGIPYGNITTSLPFDYSFFAGGSNDNRGWRARALGPGSYKYYLDPDRTATQIGDLRLSSSAEFRFSMGPLLKGAFFMDAANIWTINNDPKRPGGQFSANWYKEISLATGVGVRVDLDFFIIRVDVGIPLTNPALPNGARWIFQSRQPFYDEGIAKFGAENYKSIMPKPFTPAFHFGIGYPF